MKPIVIRAVLFSLPLCTSALLVDKSKRTGDDEPEAAEARSQIVRGAFSDNSENKTKGFALT
jgi:hypothetical protein